MRTYPGLADGRLHGPPLHDRCGRLGLAHLFLLCLRKTHIRLSLLRCLRLCASLVPWVLPSDLMIIRTIVIDVCVKEFGVYVARIGCSDGCDYESGVCRGERVWCAAGDRREVETRCSFGGTMHGPQR
jgi:hypothetical protein